MQTFTAAVTAALAMVAATGTISASTLELVKQIWKLATHKEIPGRYVGILASLISATLTVLALQPMGYPLWQACLAAVVALFTPQLAYNWAKTQHNSVNAVNPANANPSD